jgi:hypothetical protein
MPERRKCGVSIGLNEKGGMDEAEFEKYVKNNIIPLYPDALDIPGKRVLVKTSSCWRNSASLDGIFTLVCQTPQLCPRDQSKRASSEAILQP